MVTVEDKETGSALEFATLSSQDPRAAAITNRQGQTEVTAFRGAEQIEIRAMGYRPLIISYEEIRSDDFLVQLEPARISLDEVVVSATRWNQKTSEISHKVITIPTSAVTFQNPQTAADMLGVSGKVFIQKSQQGGGSPMIRGFATNRLLYAVDGVRMNTAIFRSGNIQNVISLDPFAMEQTEVFFGPGSVIYGSDAIGGVMSFRTLVPQLALTEKPLVKGNATARYATANHEKTGHLDVNVGWKKWALVTSISSNDYGNLRMGSHGPDEYLRPFYVQRHDSTDIVVANSDPQVQIPSGYSQINMMQKVRFKPGERWDLSYGFHYSATTDYARYDRHIRYRDGMPRYGEWKYGPQKWMMNNLNVTHRDSWKLYDELTIRLAQQYFEESRISRDFNRPDRETRIEKVDAWSANFDLNKSIGSKGKLYYGLEAVYNDVTSEGINENILTGTESPGPIRYPQSVWSSYAAYLSGQLRVTDNFTLESGLRYNQFLLHAEFDTTFYPFSFTTADLNNGALTGSIGFISRPTDKWIISTNVSTAFRSPNVDDVGKVFDSEPGSVVVPNPDLQAEYAWSGDLNVVKVFGEDVKIDLTGYYTLLNNALVRRDYTLNGMDSIMYDGEMSRVQAVQNAAMAHVFGLLAGLEVKLPSGFEFSSDLNYQKGKEELDDGTTSPSRHAPPLFGVSRLTYQSGKMKIQIYAEYQGERPYDEMPEEEKGKTYMYATDAAGNPYSPGWYTVNFKAAYRLTDYLLLSAGLENLTDQRYRPYSSGIAAAGRNFILSVSTNF
ncbi:MAG: TonB-dependent receptor [Bacteroidales bacterium]